MVILDTRGKKDEFRRQKKTVPTSIRKGRRIGSKSAGGPLHHKAGTEGACRDLKGC